MPGVDIRQATNYKSEESVQAPNQSLLGNSAARLASSTAVQRSSASDFRADTGKRHTQLTTRLRSPIAQLHNSPPATLDTPAPSFLATVTPPSITNCSQVHSLVASAAPCIAAVHPQPAGHRAGGFHDSSMSQQSGESCNHPRSAPFSHLVQASAETKWAEADQCFHQYRATTAMSQPPKVHKKLALLRARKGYGGHYIDFSVKDRRGIFCLDSVPCCSGPFDGAGLCTSSKRRGFCSCTLQMPVIRGVQ